ncbi:acyl carrier protein [Micromonospora sp. RTGN7]|uniref:acyl carrier protein n=1 Tax=Micromonospora sp. RTGN7 TaxID=3016526 RepID=UPI0029FEFF70|nr:phosphopantetheine-binding protein [Micromonospora sp. RTGN7]
MERSEIIEHLRISLSVVLNRELPEFSAETQILEDLEIDSIRFIELIMSLEDTLQLDVDPESLEPEVFQSAGSLADYIQTRLQQVDVAR